METLESLLKEHPFFRALAPGDLQSLTGCAKNVRFEAGQVIFREGEDADQFYLLRDGRVALEVFTLRGLSPILTIGAGEALGWSWLIPPYKWRFDARATETTLAFALDGKCLRGKCDEDPRLGYELLKRIAAIIAERACSPRLLRTLVRERRLSRQPSFWPDQLRRAASIHGKIGSSGIRRARSAPFSLPSSSPICR